MNNNPELNLARKWRPKTFKDIVGQDLTVRILKNSLYRQQFFPVYLLAGQRGCGKTTTGRVFAAALNCEKLDDFVKNPQTTELPCLQCASCQAMAAGKHPDFIEIDAASHTGVDHARQIIEATSFLPHMSRKKIYLIDEAHMLSKAAFNAFLKILEEPPMTALFLMATTDVHKIIDTVRSRCCQLFFDPVPQPVLTQHLAEICHKESLACTQEGLALIARYAQGSVRDALNGIERIRLAHDTIDRVTVTDALGLFDESWVLDLLERVAASDTSGVLALTQSLKGQQGLLVVQKLAEALQRCLLAHYGVTDGINEVDRLQMIAKTMTTARLIRALELLVACEQQMAKSACQQALLELVLIKMSDHAVPVPPARGPNPEKITTPSSAQTLERPASPAPKVAILQAAATPPLWEQFVATIVAGNDALLASVIKQGTVLEYDETAGRLKLGFSKELGFFEDMLKETAPSWQAVLQKIAQKELAITVTFLEAGGAARQAPVRTAAPVQRPVAASGQRPAGAKSSTTTSRSSLDVSDATKWEKTHSLLQLFPGTVTEAQEPS